MQKNSPRKFERKQGSRISRSIQRLPVGLNLIFRRKSWIYRLHMEHVHRVISRSRVLDGKSTSSRSYAWVYESHLSQVGCRGMSSEEFSRAPRSRCQTRVRLRDCHECLTRVSRQDCAASRCNTPRSEYAERETLFTDISFLFFFFYLPTASRHLTFRERSHSAKGSRMHLLHETTFPSDQFFVKDV